MRRRLSLAPIVLALLAAPLAAHEDPAGLCRTTPDLEGTVWVGEDVCGPQTFRFEAGGVFSYSYRRNNGKGPWQAFNNGTWRQRGAYLDFETNGRYAERYGIVRDGRMSGRGRNISGHTWFWSAVRKR